MTLKIFVYGTLMQGLANHHVIQPYGKFIDTATLIGFKMMNIGQFPAIVKSQQNEHAIKGELYELNPTTLPEAWANLDELEDYPTMYDREIVTITLRQGHQTSAWVYIWQLEPDYPLIANGNYRAFVENE